MSLTPEDIQGKRFHDAFRGYNHEEVDIFLDEVAAAFEAAFKDLQAGRARVEELEAQLDEVKGTEGILKRTLLAAQRAADEAIAEAKAEAAQLVSIAEDQAGAAVASARQRAEDIVAAANARQSQIEEADSRLQALHAAHRATLRAHLEDQLRALDGLPSLPAPGSGPTVSPPPAPAVDVAADPAPESGPEPDPVPEAQADPDPAGRPETPPEPTAAPKLLAPPEDSPEASSEPSGAVPPRPVSSFIPWSRRGDVKSGAGGGETRTRRVSREPLRPGGSASGSEEDRDRLERELFWGKD